MELEIGAIQEGKVTGITKFGAFVLLPGGKSGLVHISEIANAYVNDVNDYLKVGDAVKVKILSVNEARPAYTTRPANTYRSTPPHGGEVAPPTGDTSFEDKLKQFMQQSDSKINDSKIYADRRSGGRRRK